MSDYWQNIINTAHESSMEKFSEEVSSLIGLTKNEIVEAIPEGIDKSKLTELMKIVHDSSATNNSKAEAIRNTQGLAEIAVNLLTKL